MQKQNSQAEDGRNTTERPVTLERRMRQMTVRNFLPVIIIMIVFLIMLLLYVSRYTQILHNVTTASEFNQDFKESIDLKMYYYVVNSRYQSGLPIDEVEDAQHLAQNLLDTTTQKDSYKAINTVLNLCKNLESKMYLIEETKSYDERQLQLENNIYVLTELIQEYMYNYLYYEAQLLDDLQNQMMRQMMIEMLIVAGIMIIILYVNIRRTLAFGASITKPISELCSRVWSIREGNLQEETPVEAQEYEIQTLSNGFESMVGRLNSLLEQNRQEQIQLRNAELALLQAQINPHFLYNTLDAIVWLIEMEKNDQAVEMVTSLSSFFRSSLSKGRDIITIKEEEQQIRSYLEIQQVRYRDILSYDINIDPEIETVYVPKLTLQPLIENALYHGIKLKRGQGMITVTGTKVYGVIMLTVSDNGAGMDTERLRAVQESLEHNPQRLKESAVPEQLPERTGFGLVTVHERLQLLFGSEYGLNIDSKPGAGTTVTVTIPCSAQLPAQQFQGRSFSL